MRRFDVEIEHKYNDRLVAKHVFNGSKKLTVIGSNRNADIRLLGDGVDGVHAYLEKSDDGWLLIDAGSQQGTWMQKSPIESLKLSEPCSVRIGSHELCFRPLEFERELFTETDSAAEEGKQYFHQIVVQRNGHLISTHMVGEKETFIFPYSTGAEVLNPPSKNKYEEKEIGAYTVIQRLVATDVVQHEYKNPVDYLTGPEAKIITFALAGIIFLILLTMLALPKSNEAELEVPEIRQNKFTKMIYDADTIKKKRAEAKERQKQFARASGGPVKPNKTAGAEPTKGKTPKVVGQLKMQGLQAMLGKISARASANAVKVTGFGSAPAAGVGRAIASATPGSLDGVATNAGNGGSSFKVAGVGTIGAGGGNGLKGIGGLASGGVGSASVGILDEETEIEGGLDKDVIARVINSQLGEIRYCYERQLAAEPDIYGKVVVRFSIDAAGTVATQRVGSTSLRSAVVEGCILRRVASWKFPKPKGGTTVLVTYPFLFKSTI